MPTETYQQAIG
jgi:hypothetical protein